MESDKWPHWDMNWWSDAKKSYVKKKPKYIKRSAEQEFYRKHGDNIYAHLIAQ